MLKKKLRETIAIAFLSVLRPLRSLVRRLPWGFALGLGRTTGYLVSFFCPREMRVAAAQLAFARKRYPALGGNHPQTFGRVAFAHIGQAAVESFRIEELLEVLPADPAGGPQIPKFKYIRASGEEFCWDHISNNKATMALSGHLGCFELLCAYHSRCGFNVTVLGREPNYEALSRYVDDLRTGYGVKGVWRDGRAAATSILKAAKEGGAIALLIDQDTNLESGFAPFFGLDAASPVVPIKFAVRNKIDICSTFIVREGPCRHFVITEPVPYDPADPDAARSILTVYNARLERLIAEYPNQWLWWHRRWRRRPGIDYDREPELLRGTSQYVDWICQQTPAERKS